VAPAGSPARSSFARPKSSTFTRPSAAITTFAGFEIAVDDALLVGRGEGLGNDRGVLDDPLDGQSTLGNEAVQCLPLHELHCQEVDAVGLFDREDGDDVRVVERGEGLGLALEAREPIGVARHVGGQHLERHLAPELRVDGAIHLAHAACPDGSGNPVVGEGLADQHVPPPDLRAVRAAALILKGWPAAGFYNSRRLAPGFDAPVIAYSGR